MPPSSQMAIQLTLILISCSLYSMYSSSFTASSSLALLVLVISTCLSLLFSNLRQLLKANTHKGQTPPSMEEAVHQEKNIVPQHEVPDDGPEDLTGSLSDSSDCTVNDEERTEEGSMSDDVDDDDESLIEISLVDGHYAGVGQGEKYAFKEKDLLTEFLPDLVLDKRDFIDILSEISEEDSLIEIDIARGSIKCSNFGIKA
ncbi:uncharacterized protein LOC133905225 [Phragmites australis]|uniref:uncharacterized protein LOC133905225 n=1 Tax=Phragmites australis TaxID=29695 RepID=UPI002D77B2C9|nr:uncharacterized protein LOC133905225 [Phragmites australis]